VNASTVPEVWEHFADAVGEYGFDKVLYGGARYPDRGFLGNPEEALILYRGSQDYADAYLGEQLYLYSPTYDWATKNRGFVSWPEAIRQHGKPPTSEQMRILQLNASVGAIAGYVGSLVGVVPGMNGVIGMSPVEGINQLQCDALWARVGKEIETLCNLMHLRVSSLPQTGQRRPLTTRQREALEWYSLGKTTQDIATIMDLSPGTIEKHLKMARDALDAQTTAHAVRKATLLNLLTA
jgi:LuxR family transcriptional regulator